MPRKTKELEEPKNKRTKATAEATKKTSAKNETVKKAEKNKTTAKKETVKKSVEKKTNTKKETAKKTVEKKTSKKATTKKTTAKKVSTKKTTAKKEPAKKRTTTKKKVEVVEYYDLPYRYNQTIVKVLAQTPTNLFIYWDISDTDRKNFQKQYGDNFFETTRPILIVHNNTLNYSFEVEINDFANSWYLHVADSKCDYKIELGRRPIYKTEQLNIDYIHVATSNEIESPNDRILFDKNQKMVYFRNVKTGKLSTKNINSISFIRNMGKIYNIYDLYKAIYQNENIEEFYDINNNPSSGGNPSSNSFSLKYR